MILHWNHKEFHVERPEWIMALYFQLTETWLIEKLTKIEVKEIAEENLLAHSKLFINKVNDLVNKRVKGDIVPLEKGENTHTFTQDTYENKWTPYCAWLAAGGVIEVIDAVYSGFIQNGFCIVWPPGHHAHGSMASGFCFFNNVANGAKYA